MSTAHSIFHLFVKHLLCTMQPLEFLNSFNCFKVLTHTERKSSCKELQHSSREETHSAGGWRERHNCLQGAQNVTWPGVGGMTME